MNEETKNQNESEIEKKFKKKIEEFLYKAMDGPIQERRPHKHTLKVHHTGTDPL